MALKRDEYFWIEGKRGKLARIGRYFLGNDPISGPFPPNLCATKSEAKDYCWKGENPVKVRLVKVEE